MEVETENADRSNREGSIYKVKVQRRQRQYSPCSCVVAGRTTGWNTWLYVLKPLVWWWVKSNSCRSFFSLAVCVVCHLPTWQFLVLKVSILFDYLTWCTAFVTSQQVVFHSGKGWTLRQYSQRDFVETLPNSVSKFPNFSCEFEVVHKTRMTL